ncbi:MAG: M15 family metallopeptidase [Bacilli bacterium]|nr:M15 family metallopeptidase [Bacilli bacterium]
MKKFLTSLVVFGLIGCFIYSYITRENTENNDNNLTPITEEEKDELEDLGYSKEDITLIRENLNEEEIDEIKNTPNENLTEYVDVPYFKLENLERYIEYDNRTDYSKENTVMYVNIGLDRGFYTNIKTVSNPHDTLVLVNKYNSLPSGIEPNDLIKTESVYMQREAGEALLKMADAMRNDGISIILQSGYRSESTQTYLYNNYVSYDGVENADTYSARPNHSEHQTGLAIDLSHDGTLEEYFEDTIQFDWLSKNAYKYGFIMRYPKDKVFITGYTYEPWHYRYVGTKVASIIYNEGITFEEYYVKYIEN